MSEKYARIYYVCFRPAKRVAWWRLFTDEHIFLITACTKDSCVIIEPSNGGLGIWGHNIPARELAIKIAPDCNTIIKTLVTEREMVRPQLKLGRSCVDIAKELLGVDKWWIFTPQQLKEELLYG